MIRQTPYGLDIGLLGKESENPFPEKEEVKTDKKRKTSKKKTEATSEAESEE